MPLGVEARGAVELPLGGLEPPRPLSLRVVAYPPLFDKGDGRCGRADRGAYGQGAYRARCGWARDDALKSRCRAKPNFAPPSLREVPFDDDADKKQVHRPFCLKGVDRLLPPGDYRVVTDEELIEGLSFPAYHRISTVIFVPAQSGSAVEMVTIEPVELQAAQEQDGQ